MIPILYDKTETAFVSNGLARLRDCVSCVVSETRNGAYECDFEYPVNGAHFDLIQIGRIIGVTHDETDDIQPFDIISYTKPIEGVVTFHAVHISYRQSYLTVTGSNINSLEDVFTLFASATPTNPFIYSTDKNSTGYLSIADGVPKTVRQMLGGTEGSVLDTYGGEYVWDKWNVELLSARGRKRDFSIYYGVNMMSYNEECDSSSCYSSCIPYWTDGSSTVIGDKQTAPGITASGRDQCIPLDVSDKFEGQPTKAQVETMGLSLITSQNTTAPTQNITVSFIRLQDMAEYESYQQLMMCELCDTINVVFPESNSSGSFKIVKTTWNVLEDRYESMELGALATTLSEALGLSKSTGASSSGGGGGGGITDVTVDGTSVVQGTVAAVDLTGKSDIGHTHTKSAITDFPTIPSKTSDLMNDSGFITGYTETDPVFSASAAHGISSSDISNWNNKSDFSGSYNDLTNKPTIPTVNNATLTIQKNGTTVKTFTANASSNVTADITVPTKVSDLTNDSGFITGYTETDPIFSASAASGISSSDISTWNSKSDFSGNYNDLTNKPTIPTVPTNVSAFTNDAGYLNDATVGDLAYQDSATGSYTPAGSVTINSYTPEGTISTGTGTANYTPAGSVSAPTITVTPSTTTVNSITAVGTLPAWSASVTNEVLSFSFDTGTLPTKGSNTTVMTGASASSSQPSFTGTGANLKFTGTAKAPTGSFTGTAATITVE